MLEEVLLGPSIVHYLGAFDLCFLPVFFRLGLFLDLFLHHDGPISIPSTETHSRPRPRSRSPGRNSSSSEGHSKDLTENIDGKGEYRRISHLISHHIQNVRPIEKGECLAEHHEIEAPIDSGDTGLGRLQASTLHCFHLPPPTILLRSEPGGPFWKVGIPLSLNNLHVYMASIEDANNNRLIATHPSSPWSSAARPASSPPMRRS